MALTKITVDLETYYDKEFSLSKLTTEEYIRDERFQVIGIGVKVNDGETVWASGDPVELLTFLSEYDWPNAIMIGQNTAFDAAILKWHFDIEAKLYADTMCMSRAWDGVNLSASLANQAKRRLGKEKGTEVINAMGMRREDFSERALSKYGDYCVNDVELTYELFMQYLKEGFPVNELKIIDLTLRMFICPTLELDLLRLETHLYDVTRRKEKLIEEAGVTKEDLMSNNKFAELINNLGYTPPTKISAKTGKEAFAFAKTDQGFKDLLEHDDDRVQSLANARLGNKSTLEESRSQRFISIAKRGNLPVPIKYYGAHTGRWSGQDKINLQNLPSRGPNGKKLKNAIRAPEGYVCIEADLAQIEARMVAWLAGQKGLVEAFAKGEDVYKLMASKIYNVPVDEVTGHQRFIGKMTILGCIAEGTPVLCERGWVNIEDVTHSDRLWDGENWVCHQGLVPKGLKETQSLCGSWLTPDHKVLCGDTWVATELVAQNENMLSRALARGAENLPLQAMSKAREADLHLSSSNAVAGFQNTLSTNITSKPLNLLGAIYALKRRAATLIKSIGNTPILSQMTTTDVGYLTEYHPLSADATTRTTPIMQTTEGGVLPYHKSGATTAQSSSSTSSHVKVGINQSLKWIDETTAEVMKRVTSGLFHGQRTTVTSETSVYCKRKLRTYDVAYAGPNNRFTIWSKAGPMIVHNCGYGMGAERFVDQLKAQANVEIALDEARMIIQTYRSVNFRVKQLWKDANTMLKYLERGEELSFGKEGVIEIDADRKAIMLPNGLPMYYNDLHVMAQGEYGPEYGIKTRKGTEKIYGGKVVENTCQALAKLVIADQMLLISKKYPVALTVHDSMVAVAPKEEAEEASYHVYKSLRYVPDWATGLPLDCDVGYHEYYGSCGDNAEDEYDDEGNMVQEGVTTRCKRRWEKEHE